MMKLTSQAALPRVTSRTQTFSISSSPLILRYFLIVNCVNTFQLENPDKLTTTLTCYNLPRSPSLSVSFYSLQGNQFPLSAFQSFGLISESDFHSCFCLDLTSPSLRSVEFSQACSIRVSESINSTLIAIKLCP